MAATGRQLWHPPQPTYNSAMPQNHQPPINLRPAHRDDAAALAEIINMAGEGLPHYLWQQMAGPGEDPWEIGRSRARRDDGGFSWRNGFVATSGENIAGGLIGYPLAADPEPIDLDETPAMFVPVLELEQIAAGSWYINAVAVYDEYRGSGVGTRLMAVAEQQCDALNLSGVSLIVEDENSGARQLYEKLGYRTAAARDMVKGDWQGAGSEWILMIKQWSKS